MSSATKLNRKRNPADDDYETPAWATELLLTNVPFLDPILEPCCGRGAILDVLRDAELTAVGVELVRERAEIAGKKGHFVHCADFLNWDAGFRTWSTVLTNPPFVIAPAILERALQAVAFGGKVILLLRLAFLETPARKPLFLPGSGFQGVWILPKRPKFLGYWNEEPEEVRAKTPPTPKSVDRTPYAWFVWEKGWPGPALVRHL